MLIIPMYIQSLNRVKFVPIRNDLSRGNMAIIRRLKTKAVQG